MRASLDVDVHITASFVVFQPRAKQPHLRGITKVVMDALSDEMSLCRCNTHRLFNLVCQLQAPELMTRTKNHLRFVGRFNVDEYA